MIIQGKWTLYGLGTIKVNLLYNAQRDGDSVKIFHEKCDGHNNTLTIIRTDKEKYLVVLQDYLGKVNIKLKKMIKDFFLVIIKKKYIIELTITK